MDFDAIIVGGGLVGSSLAASLANSGLKLALVESSPISAEKQGWDARIYAISPGSARFLEKCGGWGKMDKTRINPVREMRIFGDDGQSELRFSAEDVGVSELAWILESRNLLGGLEKSIEDQENLKIFRPAACRDMVWSEDSIELDLEDARLNAKLIVGADGARSWLRQHAGFEINPRPYNQMGVVANFECDKPHRDTAWQWFRKDGVLAFLPMPENRISIVWSIWTEEAEKLMADPQFSQKVMEASNNRLGELKPMTPPQAFPLRLMRVSSLVKPRVALVGDAAHNTHPLAGQGVNLGFRDARELSEVLINRGPQKDCGDYHLLRKFDRARREDILTMQSTTDMLQKLFNNELPGIPFARNIGLRMVEGQPWLKNALIQHALA